MKDLVEEVKKILEDNFWLVLATADEKNQPQSSVVVYQSDGDVLYVQTGIETLKARNIKRNNKVSHYSF